MQGGKVADMTETSKSPSVIIGPEIHPAGTHTETVRYRLPFGGNLVLRLMQDERWPERFRAYYGARPWELFVGGRADVLDAIEAHARMLGEREVRRREGSTDPKDHVAPPAALGWRELWLHLCTAYVAWCRLGEGRGPMLPDQSRRQANVHNKLRALPWIDDEAGLRNDLTADDYRIAYVMWQSAWSDADDTWRYLRDARDRLGW